MATIVDALVVTFGIDPTEFEKGRKKVDKSFDQTRDTIVKRTKEIEGETKKASAVFSELRTDVLALMAVFLGGRGLEEFIKDIGFADAQLSRIAKTTGMSVNALAQWRGAAELAGGSGEGLIATLQGLADQYNQWQLTGDSAIAPALRALQVMNPNLRLDNNGRMADLGQFLLQLSDTVKGMPAPRARSILQMLGIDSDTINVILQGRGALEQYLAAVKRLQGPVEQSAAAGRELQTAYGETKVALDGVGRTLLVAIAPALIEVLHLIRDFALWAQQHPKLIEAAFWAITAAVLALSAALAINLVRFGISQTVGAFGVLLGTFGRLLMWLGLLTVEALPALGEALWAVGAAIEATPVGWLLTGLALIAGAAYLIYDNWGPIKQWWHDLWTSMGFDVDKVNKTLREFVEGGLMLIPGGQGLAAQMIAEDVRARAAARAGGGGGAGVTHPGPGSNAEEDTVQAMLKKMFPGVRITGGARTVERNRQVGGAANSMHLRGQAVDFKLPAGVSFDQFKSALDASGFPYTELFNEGRIGSQGAHIHLGWGAKGRYLATPRTGTGGRGNVSSTKIVHHKTDIGSIVVHSQAADARGIVGDIRRELQQHGLAVQANSGLA